MPGLTPGALIEYAYRSDHKERKGQKFQNGPFYFQDTRFKEPFLLSRFVVILPKGFGPGFMENNLKESLAQQGHSSKGGQGLVEFARVEKTVRELENGQTAYIFEARNVPRLERAQFLPPSEEYIPNVAVLERSTWDDVAGTLRSRYAGSTRATPELAEAAAKVIAGI